MVGAKTRQDAEAAIDAGERYLDEHPEDKQIWVELSSVYRLRDALTTA